MIISRHIKIILISSIIIINVGCDQVTKYFADEKLDYYNQVELFSEYLVLKKVQNSGAFFGIGSNLSQPVKKVFLLGFPAIMLIILLGYLLLRPNLGMDMNIGLSFIIGGGLGNIIDRFKSGYVIDFLHIHIGFFKTGIFNLADVSVMTGTAIIFIFSSFNKVKD